MKKSILAFILILSALFVSGQQAGVLGGANFANFYNTSFNTKDIKVSPSIGVYAKLPLVRDLFLQPEFIYSNRGSKVSYSGIDGTSVYKLNLHYLDIPVSLVAHVTPIFYVSGGGYVGFLADANVKNEGIIETQNIKESGFNRWDAGIQAGTGVELGGIGFYGRYSLGLLDVGKSGTPMEGSKNNFITIGANIPFNN